MRCRSKARSRASSVSSRPKNPTSGRNGSPSAATPAPAGRRPPPPVVDTVIRGWVARPGCASTGSGAASYTTGTDQSCKARAWNAIVRCGLAANCRRPAETAAPSGWPSSNAVYRSATNCAAVTTYTL